MWCGGGGARHACEMSLLSPQYAWNTPYEYLRLIAIGPHHRAHRHAQSDPRCPVSGARSTARAQERRVLHELVLLNGHDCATQALDGVHRERSDPQLRLQLVPACARASAHVRMCAWKRGKAAACKRECAKLGLTRRCASASGRALLTHACMQRACAAACSGCLRKRKLAWRTGLG